MTVAEDPKTSEQEEIVDAFKAKMKKSNPLLLVTGLFCTWVAGVMIGFTLAKVYGGS